MPETTPSPGMPRAASVALGWAVAALAVGAVAWAHGPNVPTPREVLAADALEAERHGASLAAALLAAVLTGVALMVRRANNVDAVARVLAVGLAAGLPLYAVAVLPGLGLGMSVAMIFGAGVLSAGVSVLAAPLLADRGVLAMALAAGVASAPAVLAYRAVRLRSFEVPVIAELVGATAPERWSGNAVSLVVDPDLDPVLRAVLPRLLRPPFRSAPLELVVATMESPSARWLERMEWPVLQLRQGRCMPRPLVPVGQRLLRGALPVTATMAGTGGERVPVVTSAAAPSGSLAIVLSPVGEFVFVAGADGSFRPAVDDSAVRARLELLRALPSGLRMRAVVVPPDPADAYGWADFQT